MSCETEFISFKRNTSTQGSLIKTATGFITTLYPAERLLMEPPAGLPARPALSFKVREGALRANERGRDTRLIRLEELPCGDEHGGAPVGEMADIKGPGHSWRRLLTLTQC